MVIFNYQGQCIIFCLHIYEFSICVTIHCDYTPVCLIGLWIGLVPFGIGENELLAIFVWSFLYIIWLPLLVKWTLLLEPCGDACAGSSEWICSCRASRELRYISLSFIKTVCNKRCGRPKRLVLNADVNRLSFQEVHEHFNSIFFSLGFTNFCVKTLFLARRKHDLCWVCLKKHWQIKQSSSAESPNESGLWRQTVVLWST